MMLQWLFVLFGTVMVVALPQMFHTETFRVGIEYDNSLPMHGGSDRYRHRNNYDPFFVTVTTRAKNNFVITYLDVTATVDEGGEIDFRVVRGQTGATSISFQLVSNHSDFLSFSYLAYGIRNEEYRKPWSQADWWYSASFARTGVFAIHPHVFRYRTATYGITNIITIPMPNNGWSIQNNLFSILCIVLYYFINNIVW